MIDVYNLNPKQALQAYLILSFCYYIKYESIVPDKHFDDLARYLLEHFDEWQSHQHAKLISKGDLEAGTAYSLKYNDYPTMVRVASDMYLREYFQQNGGVV